MKRPLDFDLMTTEGAERWRKVERSIDAAEKFVAAAANNPASLIGKAQTTFAFVRIKQDKLQNYLHERFGIELDDPLGDASSRPRIRVVSEERRRKGIKTLKDAAEMWDVLIRLMIYNAASWAMARATREGTLAWGAKEANARWWARFGVARPVLPPTYASSASLAAYLHVMRNGPILYGPLARDARRSHRA